MRASLCMLAAGAMSAAAWGQTNAVAEWKSAEGIITLTRSLDAKQIGKAKLKDGARGDLTAKVESTEPANAPITLTKPQYALRGKLLTVTAGFTATLNQTTSANLRFDLADLDTPLKAKVEIARTPVSPQDVAAAVQPQIAKVQQLQDRLDTVEWRFGLAIAVAGGLGLTSLGWLVFVQLRRPKPAAVETTSENEPPEDPLADLKREVKTTQKALLGLEEKIVREFKPPPFVLPEWLGTQEQVATLWATPGAAAAPNMAAPPSGLAQEEELLLSALHWWASQRTPRREQLVEAAERLGLRVVFYAHEDLGRFKDPTVASYRFAPDSEQGSWVCCEVRDGLWAAPILASYFFPGLGPQLLQRLFEGYQAGSNAEFEMVRAACRLRSTAANEYKVDRRGVLQMAGQPATGAPGPRPFQQLLAARNPQLPSVRPNLATLIETQIARLEGIEGRIRQWEAGQARMQEDLRHLPEVLQSTWREDLANLRRELASAKPTTAPDPSLSNRLADLERQVKALEGRAAVPPPRAAEFSPATTRPTPPVATSTQSPPAPAPVITPRWEPPVPEALRSNAEDWDESRDREGYRKRLVRLARVLQAAGLPGVSLAHMRVDDQKLEVHLAPAAWEIGACDQCGAEEVLEFGVCAWGPGRARIAVFLPPGYFSYSDFSGYQLLIRDVPMGPFQIAAIRRPALLELLSPTEPDVYRVAQPLEWD